MHNPAPDVAYTYGNQSIQPTSLTDPDLGTIGYAYDRHGRLDTQTDARGVTLDIGWDNANRPLTIKHLTGSTSSLVSRWTYDPAGAAGQLATAEQWNRRTNGTEAGYVEQTHTYNTRHQVASTTWQIPGLAGSTQTIGYTYRDSGAVDTITYPDGTVIDYGHNRIEQLTSITADGTNVARSVGYDAQGRPTTLHRGTANSPNDLKTTRTYDPDTQRLTNLTTTDTGGVEVQDYTYSYTVDDGMVASINDTSTIGGQAVNQSSCYRYDSLYQLTKAFTRVDHNCDATGTDSAGVDPYGINYTYNPIGGLTTASGIGTVQGAYTYPAAGQPRPHAPTAAGNNTYTYDQAGNRASLATGGQSVTYTYDVQNRLLTIDGTGQGAGSGFLYDTSGARVRRTVPSEPTVHYLGAGYETDSNGDHTIHVTIAGQTVGAVKNGTVWATATDHLGSANYSASPTGTVEHQRYLPYGGLRGTGGHTQPTDRAYTGQLNDHNGLYHYQARYYDATLSQFTQPDTWTPDPTNTLDWNRYTYTRNNPINNTDPTGHEPCRARGGFGGLCNHRATNSARSAESIPLRPFHWMEAHKRNTGVNREAVKATGEITAGALPVVGEAMDFADCLPGSVWGCVGLALPIVSGRSVGRIAEALQDTRRPTSSAPNAAGRTPWTSFDDYPKVTINGRQYADVGGRPYTQHAVDRMQPSGLGSSGMPGGASGPGRNISPNYVEDVLTSNQPVRKPAVGPNGEARRSYTSGTVEVITKPSSGGEIVITVITR
jgi:RHS repeat-associated protein